MQTSTDINEIASALAKAQGEMEPASKSASNPAFKGSKYADLAAVIAAIKAPFAKNGISYVQETTTTERGVACATRLMHSSGQWMQFDPLTVPTDKVNAHGIGSATTYARRYSLSSSVGLSADDDDANVAVGNGNGNGHTATQPVEPPEGYRAWLVTLQKDADKGSAKLNESWAVAPEKFRNYLTGPDGAIYEALRSKARAVK